MIDLPGISVIIATRNRVGYLKRSLEALLDQDYPNLEIVIADGGSTDGTVDLLKSYGERIGPWISAPDEGEYFAYNSALAMSSKEIVKPMTDDDRLRPGALRMAGTYLAGHPDVDILFGQTVSWDEGGGASVMRKDRPIADKAHLKLRNWLRETQRVLVISSFIRRRVFDKIGSWSTEFTCGDIEFCVRAAEAGLRMDVHPDVFVDYCYTGANGVFTKRNQLRRDIVRINWRYGGPLDAPSRVFWHYCAPSLGKLCAFLGFHPIRIARRLRGGPGGATSASDPTH